MEFEAIYDDRMKSIFSFQFVGDNYGTNGLRNMNFHVEIDSKRKFIFSMKRCLKANDGVITGICIWQI